ncbi:MAG: chemotaxis response regulator protein-glutamate methylesterase [Mariprofundaceae bacterium]
MRIGIVNDMPMALELLRRIVTSMPGHEVAWLARHGAEAILKCCEDTPDLILMDLVMPGIDGAETTRRIMRKCPCAILVVTASVKANQALAFEALAAGGMDVVMTPVAATNMDGESDRDDSLQKKITRISRLIGNNTAHAEHKIQTRPMPTQANDSDKNRQLIAIGASTGGPAAVVDVLKTLPANFSAAVVVVVHVDEEFAPGMAVWMDGFARLPVRLACEGERPKAGEVLLASTNEHLVLTRQQTLHYTPEPVDYAYRPSVDAFFSSLALHWRGTATGVLLTGMGRDGAKGLKAMREHGWHTIAQDEKSSAIYGMPKAAAKIGAAREVLPLKLIGPSLIALVGQQSHAANSGMNGGNHVRE